MNYSEKWKTVLNLNLKPQNSVWSTNAIGKNESAQHSVQPEGKSANANRWAANKENKCRNLNK